MKGLLRQVLRQSDIICAFRNQNLQSERFRTVKEPVNDNPIVHLIQPEIDDHEDLLGNKGSIVMR